MYFQMKVNKLQMCHDLRNSHVEMLCASMEAHEQGKKF